MNTSTWLDLEHSYTSYLWCGLKHKTNKKIYAFSASLNFNAFKTKIK